MEHSVKVNMELKDGRAYLSILTSEEMHPKLVRSILVGAVNMSIRSEKTPEDQGKALKEIISYMESELVSVDSFGDLYSREDKSS